MDDSSPPSDNPVIFQCPKCALLCEEWGEADKRPHEGRCRHCLATITVPKRSSIPAQYEVENVDFQYDLAHVFQCISEGWDVFRDLGSAIGLSVFDHLSDFAKPTKRLDERIADGIYEVVTCAGPGYGLIAPNLRDMAFEMTFPRGKCMHGKEETARRRYDKELTPEQQLQASRLLAQALSRPGSIQECLTHVWPIKTIQKATRVCIHSLWKDLVDFRLSDNDRQKMSWICKGVESHDACDEAWWKCVALETQVAAEELRTIQDKVSHEEPLSRTEHHCLNEYLTNATPYLIWRYDDDGSGEYVVKVLPNFSMINAHPMRATAIALLVQPAYEIARGVEEWCKRVGPRYVVTCRNPQCGRTFYSGHPDAVACPKKPNTRVTSPCKREWDKYSRWLRSQGHNADVDWPRKDLKAQYLPPPPQAEACSPF